jgi:NTP pyrophosphatase (non-canonical NTP hydrolase)
MNTQLLDYIKKLSLDDKKTLSQKALKVAEESGELAKVVLPFDNAAGTIHRFIEKGRILEESVDVILTAISIAYELGYSHEEIEEIMRLKAEKWQGIQFKETQVDDMIPFEIHVTVQLKEGLEDRFRGICGIINSATPVKPIILELENKGQSIMQDVMTSSHFFGTNTGAYNECLKIERVLEGQGFKVVRKKIETVPWHPAAPVGEAEMPKDCYFEAHIGCIINEEQRPRLQELAEINNAHLSRNFFKKLDNGMFVNMLTLRWYDCNYEKVKHDVQRTKLHLTRNGMEYEKVIVEFCLYDTKVSHDFKWLEK